MILAIGEILFDQFPNYKRIGGAPFNFSYHLKQFGLPVRFISRVGMDADGREIMAFLKKRGFPTRDIQVDPRHPTGLVLVELSEGGLPAFEIVPDVAYDHISYEDVQELPGPADVDMIYFGSVVQRTDEAHRALHQFISEKYPRTKVFLDINLRAGCINRQAVMASLETADILKLNQEELDYLKEAKGIAGDTEEFVPLLMSEYGLELVALTLGAQGSVIYTPDERVSSQAGTIRNLADTVGAGDAYASVLAMGYIRNWPAQVTIRKASDFAAGICELEGAIPASLVPYQEFSAGL
jgi:fructokinase